MVKNIWFWLIQFFCWFFIAFISLSYSPLQDSDTNSKILFFFTYLFVGFSIGNTYRYIIENINFDEITTLQFLFYPFLGSCLIGLAFTMIDILLGQFVLKNSVVDFFILLFENMWIVIPCFFFYHLYRFSIVYQDRKQRTIVAENLLQISELENLKKQLNPHFLFNALNSIKALTLFDSVKARESIIQLSDLFRYQNYASLQDFVTIKEEIDFLTNYLDLMKLRLKEKLTYHFDIPAELNNFKIIPMLLQPLVENAVNHGIAKNIKPSILIIRMKKIEQNILISIEDTGIGFIDKNKALTKGIGLSHAKMRLNKIYNSELLIDDNTPSGTVISFKI